MLSRQRSKSDDLGVTKGETNSLNSGENLSRLSQLKLSSSCMRVIV